MFLFHDVVAVSFVVDTVGVEKVRLDDHWSAQYAVPRENLERVRHGDVVVEGDDARPCAPVAADEPSAAGA